MVKVTLSPDIVLWILTFTALSGEVARGGSCVPPLPAQAVRNAKGINLTVPFLIYSPDCLSIG
jgi:hypothetical protein